jgi:uncharacterized phage protein (TIGR01671 family)
MNIRKSIGLKDRRGKTIHVGDIVEYHVTYDFHYPPRPFYGKRNGGTRMVDTVKLIKGVPYFWDNDFGGAFAWRHNKYCKIIGNIYENKKR